MIVGSASKVQSVDLACVKLCDQTIIPADTVRNLGVVLDSNLLMDKHISYLRKTCYNELRKISHLRPYLSEENTNKLVCCFVTSRLDYCNSLLAGLPNSKLSRLQQIQNNAARLVKRISKNEHITPILKELHWLPIPSRINYKILTTVFQCINDTSYKLM